MSARIKRGTLSLVLVGAMTASLLLPATPAGAAAMTVAAELVDVADDGACSLREAIANANADAQTHADCPAGSGADTIMLPGGTYDLDFPLRAGSPSDSAFQITSEISLIGAGSVARVGGTATVLDANGASRAGLRRHFFVENNASLHLEDLRLQDGWAHHGGAIFNGGYTSTLRVRLTGNEASGFGSASMGGAIAQVDGSFVVNDTTFTDNVATGSGGAIFSAYVGTETYVTDSLFARNQADEHGGAIANEQGSLTQIKGTVMTQNVAPFGAALRNSDKGMLEVGWSTISGNTATALLGGSAIDNVESLDDDDWTAHLSMGQSTVDGNDATGIRNRGGYAGIYTSTISNNAGEGVGGIWNRHNIVCEGGACTPVYAAMLVEDSTISSNSTLHGGVGGIFSESDNYLALSRVTVTKNDSKGDNDAEAQLVAGSTVAGSTVVKNTLVSRPLGGKNCHDLGPGAWIGHNNLTDDGSCGSGGFAWVADLMLGPLEDNGGPTLTHMPHPASPVIDAGDNQTCQEGAPSWAPTDQRGTGFPRTVGDSCDVGAVEADVDDLLLMLWLHLDALRFQAGPAPGNEGLRNSPQTKVEEAMDAVERDDYEAASGQLGAFQNQVAAHRGKRIAEADADRLIMGAEAIVGLFPSEDHPPEPVIEGEEDEGEED